MRHAERVSMRNTPHTTQLSMSPPAIGRSNRSPSGIPSSSSGRTTPNSLTCHNGSVWKPRGGWSCASRRSAAESAVRPGFANRYGWLVAAGIAPEMLQRVKENLADLSSVDFSLGSGRGLQGCTGRERRCGLLIRAVPAHHEHRVHRQLHREVYGVPRNGGHFFLRLRDFGRVEQSTDVWSGSERSEKQRCVLAEEFCFPLGFILGAEDSEDLRLPFVHRTFDDVYEP
jgi:hypothetical protein